MAVSSTTRDFAEKIVIHKFRDWTTDFDHELRQRLVEFIVAILCVIIPDHFIRFYLKQSTNYMTVLCSALFYALTNFLVLKKSSYFTLQITLVFVTSLIFIEISQRRKNLKEYFYEVNVTHSNGTVQTTRGSWFLPS